MHVAVVSIFPQLVRDAMRSGVVGRALARGGFVLSCVDPREHTQDAHRTVDDRPYGGGPGMVMKVGPLRAALREAMSMLPAGSRRIALTADGRRFDQALAREASAWPGLVLVAGRYEGIDERFLEAEIEERWSIGDYVLSGGELPALVVIDAIVRLLPGTLGDAESAQQESFSAGLLDWPHYTRPPVFEGREVPPVLAAGDHRAIGRWRLKQALGRTWLYRPDLLERRTLSASECELLEEFKNERTRQ